MIISQILIFLVIIYLNILGVLPKNGDWTPEDSLRFQNLVQDKEFVSVVKKVIPNQGDDKMLFLELSLVDTTDKNLDVHINEVLIKENRAIKA